MNALLLVLASGALAQPAARPSLAVQDIGVAAAVRGDVRAVAPGQEKAIGRVVGSGKPLYLNDAVTTGKGARLQILLLDETTFTIGPEASMTLDEFVYDPATNKGRVSAQISKGAFRFVTGKIARRDVGDMKVRLPTGTIGIRGTITDGVVHENGDADVALGGPGPDNNAGESPGGITVFNEAGAVDIDQSGYMTSLRGARPPTPPVRVTPEFQRGLDLTDAGGGGAAKGGEQADAGAEGGPGSAAEGSGDATAQGGESAELLFAAEAGEEKDETEFAAQLAGAQANQDNGLSRWEDVQLLTGGGGQAGYQGSGTYVCSGSCSQNGGTMSFLLAVDFTNKTVGGGSSAINLSGPIESSTNLNSISYAALTSGNAAFDISSAATNFTFQSVRVQFLNRNGAAAGAAEVSFTYDNFESAQASGSGRGDLGTLP